MQVSARQRTIELALLGYILFVVALLTLSPFRFAWPTTWVVAWWGDQRDASVNFLFFLPVGYFFRLALPRSYSHPVLHALLFGLAVSFMVESLQLFLPDRLTSLLDFLCNGAGTAAGAILCNAIRRRLDRLLPTVLTLQHPLLNLVYLTLPLMWLSGVAIDAEPARVWLLAPLGVVGAVTLIGLWRYRFVGAAAMPRPALAVAIQGWFLFGAVTGLASAPQIVAQCAGGIFLFTLVWLYAHGPVTRLDNRFEKNILVAIWPVYAAYLLLMVLWPLEGAFVAFDFAFGYPEYGFGRDFTVRIAEQIGALTLLGYVVAESFGRSRLGARALLVRHIVISAFVALVLEILHGFLPGDRASIARWLLGSIAAGFGIALYAAQLNVVQLLRGNPPPTES